MPTKTHTNASSPLWLMQQYNERGQAYTITVSTVDGEVYSGVAVNSHNADWLEVSDENGHYWLNVRHIIYFQVNLED